MLPIAVDLTRVRVVLVGEGSAARRRLALLDEAGSRELEVYAPDPTPGLLTASGDRLRARWPEPEEIRRGQLVFLAGVPDAAARRIRRIAMCAGVLLNVEDDRAGSNFHSCSVLRRGDLTVAVSTNGRSPGLAAALRRQLEAAIGRNGEIGSNYWRICAPSGVPPASAPQPSRNGRRPRYRTMRPRSRTSRRIALTRPKAAAWRPVSAQKEI